MKAFGLTGGIGAGKSVVARIFRTLGIAVYDADTEAKRLMHMSAEVMKSVKELFGEESYQSGQLDRSYIAKIVFHHPERLEELNRIVHPAVAEDFQGWLLRQNGVYVLKEAALLYETGSHSELDGVIVVNASEGLRMDRVLQRDTHRDETQIRAIMDRQMDADEKIKMADFVIVNDETQPLIPQVLHIHQEICS